MSIINELVYNHTQVDVGRAYALRNKILTGGLTTLTAEEKTEYLVEAKSAYDYMGLNRLGEAVAYLIEQMKKLDIHNGLIVPKVDWAIGDTPIQSQARSLLSCLIKLRVEFSLPDDASSVSNSLDKPAYQTTSDMEPPSWMTGQRITQITAVFRYSRMMYCGQQGGAYSTKDTSTKSNGKSSIIKVPSDMPTTFDAWREQFLTGEGYLDVRLNADVTGGSAGCNEIDTTLNKANLLNDTTKAALELTQADPAVNDILYALSQKDSPAEVHVVADNGTQVMMSRGSEVLTAQVPSGEAILYPAELGDWGTQYTFDGSQKIRTWTLEIIGIVYVYPFGIGDTMSDTDREDIDICGRLGTAEKFFKVGDTKAINIDGINYEVQIIDFNHGDKVSGDKAPMTFQLVDCLSQTAQMNSSNTNTGGQSGSVMGTRMATYKSQFLTALRNIIKTVRKKSGTGGGSSSDTQTTNDDLFLLFEIEVFGTTTYSVVGKGIQYAWYKTGNTRIKEVNGSANNWWERSSYSGSTGNSCYVVSSEDVSYDGTGRSRGVPFGLCI